MEVLMQSLRRRIVQFSVGSFGLAFAGPAEAVSFADGGTHVVDAANSFPFESATVADGPGATTTTVDLVSGGAIATQGGSGLDAFGSSHVNVSGGSLGGFLIAHDASQVSIS